MFKQIFRELETHAPFTIFGAITGIVIMVVSHKISYRVSYNMFYILHPIHVVLSALVTASMYNLNECGYKGKCKLWILLIIGYIGSVGIATVSDSLIPYLGEVLLRMPNRGIHIGFIEKWWLVNPLAILGVAIAYFRPTTKFPHAGHVLLSTWASLFHITMALGQTVNWFLYLALFLFLFISVWVPCCLSDIIFPLLFVKNPKEKINL
jgi:MFS family permease